jgi:glycosyltransferase involved in cell wall biosynthesis
MASGTPVVSTAVGGVPDLLENGRRGELCSARDPDALAEAILRALSAEARTRAISIRPAILEQFGGARLCADLERLYDGLLQPTAQK